MVVLGLWWRSNSTHQIEGRVPSFYYRWFCSLLSSCYTPCFHHIKHTDTDKSTASLFSIQVFHLFNVLCAFIVINTNAQFSVLPELLHCALGLCP